MVAVEKSRSRSAVAAHVSLPPSNGDDSDASAMTVKCCISAVLFLGVCIFVHFVGGGSSGACVRVRVFVLVIIVGMRAGIFLW